jgi:hypothetical protein
MKKFLLITGDHYYPRSGTDNWIGCFTTREEAENAIIKEPFEYKGKTLYRYKTNDENYVDWYEIVDLEEWMNK